VAGAPHSFIQQLSQPYYGRRPVVPLPGESVQLTPQTHAGNVGDNGTRGWWVGSFRVELQEEVMGGGLSVEWGAVGAGRLTAAYGSSGTTANTHARGRGSRRKSREESEPVAEGNALGDLFEYKLKETRGRFEKNQSALVPILQTDQSRP